MPWVQGSRWAWTLEVRTGILVWAYSWRSHRMPQLGKIGRAVAEEMIQRPKMDLERWAVSMEEAIEEPFAFDDGIRAFNEWVTDQGQESLKFPEDGFGRLAPSERVTPCWEFKRLV